MWEMDIEQIKILISHDHFGEITSTAVPIVLEYRYRFPRHMPAPVKRLETDNIINDIMDRVKEELIKELQQ